MKKTAFVCLLILISIQVFAQQSFDTLRIRPQKLTESIYMLKGAGGNIGLLVGKEGTLMIDDQFAPLSNKINGAIKTIDPGDIKFLINTHIHGDHSGGNENFRRMDATIVAHDQVRERMMKESVNPFNKTASQPRDKDAWPTITFGDVMNFHLNGEDIELIHLSPGHTDGDVLVHFKKANIYHTGDTFTRGGYPYIDLSNGGSFTGYITSLDKTLSLLDDNSKIIPGHGDLATKADVKAFRDKLADIRDQVASALKKGTKVEDMAALGIIDKYDLEWGKNGFIKGKDFIVLVAENLKAQMPVKPGKK